MEQVQSQTADVDAFLKRRRVSAILSALGGVFAFVAVMATSFGLKNTLNNYERTRAEVENLEIKRTQALIGLRQLEVETEKQRQLLTQLTTHARQDTRAPEDLIQKAQQSISVSASVSSRVANLIPTVDIIIADEKQRTAAAAIKVALEAQGYRVKFIRSLGEHGIAPAATEIRYFRNPEDRLQASELSDFLKEHSGIEAKPAYVIDRATPANEFEIWFSKNDLPEPATSPTAT
jgi:hypothetical protein